MLNGGVVPGSILPRLGGKHEDAGRAGWQRIGGVPGSISFCWAATCWAARKNRPAVTYFPLKASQLFNIWRAMTS